MKSKMKTSQRLWNAPIVEESIRNLLEHLFGLSWPRCFLLRTGALFSFLFFLCSEKTDPKKKKLTGSWHLLVDLFHKTQGSNEKNSKAARASLWHDFYFGSFFFVADMASCFRPRQIPKQAVGICGGMLKLLEPLLDLLWNCHTKYNVLSSAMTDTNSGRSHTISHYQIWRPVFGYDRYQFRTFAYHKAAAQKSPSSESVVAIFGNEQRFQA